MVRDKERLERRAREYLNVRRLIAVMYNSRIG